MQNKSNFIVRLFKVFWIVWLVVNIAIIFGILIFNLQSFSLESYGINLAFNFPILCILAILQYLALATPFPTDLFNDRLEDEGKQKELDSYLTPSVWALIILFPVFFVKAAFNGYISHRAASIVFVLCTAYIVLGICLVNEPYQYKKTIKAGENIYFFEEEIDKISKQKGDYCYGSDGNIDLRNASLSKTLDLIQQQKNKGVVKLNILLEASKGDSEESRSIRCLVKGDGIAKTSKFFKIAYD